MSTTTAHTTPPCTFKDHASCLGQSQLWLHLFLCKIFYNSWKCSGKHFPVFVRLYNEKNFSCKIFLHQKIILQRNKRSLYLQILQSCLGFRNNDERGFLLLLLLCLKHTPKEFWAMTLPPTTFIGRGGTVWTRAHWREEMFLWHHQWC